MPMEPKRAGISETDILVAFPFVLQGDFILSANREDILRDNDWNKALISATTDLIVSSVDAFNDTGLLKYTWPRYLRWSGFHSETVFQSFYADLLQRLRSHPVLLSQFSTLENPSRLLYLPSQFADDSKPPRPLLLGNRSLRDFASADYEPEDLEELDVPSLDDRTFVDMLEHTLTDANSDFKAKSQLWHARLAKAVVSVGVRKYGITGLPLIPLCHGHWVSATDGPFYFPEISDGLNVPNGIKFVMVDESAAKSEWRRKLYKELGAASLDSTQVFKQILDQHKHYDQDHCSWSVDDVVNHARFLHDAPSRPAYFNLSVLRVASRESCFHGGRDLYMDSPNTSFRISELFGLDNPVIHFIHERYLDEDTPTWLSWLQGELGVATRPKLEGSDGDLTKEFCWLMETKPSTVWLLLLRDNVDHASGPWHKTVAAMKKAAVLCTDSIPRKFSEVYLATSDVASESLSLKTVPFIKVDDPEHPGWLRLSHFGLGISRDLCFYLTILHKLPSLSQDDFSLIDVKRIYSEIGRRMRGSEQEIRDIFHESKLVYLDTPGLSGWNALHHYRWRSSALLSTVVPLSRRYENLRELFVGTLKIRDSDAADVVEELCNLANDVQHLTTMNKLLNQLCSFSPWSPLEVNALARLNDSNVAVFPVRSESGTLELRSAADTSWFIADRARLKNAFTGKLALLDIEKEQLVAMWPLLDNLGLQTRRLSYHAIEETEICAAVTFHDELTNLLRSKAHYVAYLVTPESREQVEQRFAAIELYSTESLVLRRRIATDTGPVLGQDETGWVVVTETAGQVYVYISSAAIEDRGLPYKPLNDRLMDVFQIDSAQELLMVLILTTNHGTAIEDILERAEMIPDALTSPKGLGAGIAKDISSFASDHITDIGNNYGSGLSPSQAPLRSCNRTGRRLGVGSSQAAPGDILKSAETFDFGSITILGSPRSIGDLAHTVALTHPENTSRSVRSGPSSHSNAFNMRALGSALGGSTFTTPASTVFIIDGPNTGARYVSVSPSTRANEWQQEIGCGGEIFIFKLLRETFQITDDCWTSASRTSLDLPSFNEFEGDYSDFTVRDPLVCAHITRWLVPTRHFAAALSAGATITYHFEVKTTSGRCKEPFRMSNNQVEHVSILSFNVKLFACTKIAQARRCHSSRSEVYIILRVYDFFNSPRVCAHVDPFALSLDNTLSFSAHGGYQVQPV
ncbi:hypothetical protein LTR95_012179 [Oleoguttula sp. CCFEE 5521]